MRPACPCYTHTAPAAITSCVPEYQLEVIFRVLPSQVVDCLFAHNRHTERTVQRLATLATQSNLTNVVWLHSPLLAHFIWIGFRNPKVQIPNISVSESGTECGYGSGSWSGTQPMRLDNQLNTSLFRRRQRKLFRQCVCFSCSPLYSFISLFLCFSHGWEIAGRTSMRGGLEPPSFIFAHISYACAFPFF